MVAGQPLFVGTLRKRERSRLESARSASTDARYRDRCRAILWSAAGKGVPEIATLLGVHRTTAQRWLKDYLHSGIGGLEIGKPTGRPPKVDSEVEAVISRAVDQNPLDLGHPFSRWTASTMTVHVARETHVRVHPGTVRRAMKRLGLSWKRPRLSLKHRQDKVARGKAKRARDRSIKRAVEEPDDHVFLFQDECEVHLNPSLSSCWGPIGEPILVPSAGQNRKVPIFGSLNAVTGKVIVDLTARKRSADFIAHLRHVLRVHRGRHIWLFLDNCSIHNSQVVQRFVADCRDRLTLIWNAPYTPELNLIERYWGHLKSTALNNYFFETIVQLEEAIRSAIRHLNKKGKAKMNTVLTIMQSARDAA